MGGYCFPRCWSDYDDFGHDEFSFGNRTVANGVEKEGPVLSKLGSSSTAELHPKGQGESKATSMPPTSVMTRLILIMVWRKLIRNPNTYSSLFGLTWSLISFKYATYEYSMFPMILGIQGANVVLCYVAGGMLLCPLSLLDPYQFYLMPALGWQCLALVCFLRKISISIVV